MKILTLGIGFWVEKELKNNLKGLKKNQFFGQKSVPSSLKGLKITYHSIFLLTQSDNIESVKRNNEKYGKIRSISQIGRFLHMLAHFGTVEHKKLLVIKNKFSLINW